MRERASLRKVDDWRTHGIDPHHRVLDAQGDLLLANGGIARWHPTEGAAMLRRPQPMALDNHWAVMADRSDGR